MHMYQQENCLCRMLCVADLTRVSYYSHCLHAYSVHFKNISLLFESDVSNQTPYPPGKCKWFGCLMKIIDIKRVYVQFDDQDYRSLADLPPNPGRNLLSYPNKSRSKTRLIFSSCVPEQVGISAKAMNLKIDIYQNRKCVCESLCPQPYA